MNWNLILRLSLFGLAMAIATVFVIPSNVEPYFWLVIFVICAYLIAVHARRRYFLHGLATSLVNSIWITSAHVVFFNTYIANHQAEAAMMTAQQFPWPPQVVMAVMGPIVGVASGIVLGIFAQIASRLFKRFGAPASPV